jgi:hypothetical protein
MAKQGQAGLPRWVFPVAIALVIAAATFYGWIGLTRPAKADWWALMGDSGAPFAALFNAGALLAALWAVHLQRQESHDASQSTSRQLKAMSDQVAEFARAADAQQELGESQKRLAAAQEEANRLMPFQELATRRATIATLYGVIAQLDLACATESLKASSLGVQIKNATSVARKVSEQRMQEEAARIIDLERKLGINAHEGRRGEENG